MPTSAEEEVRRQRLLRRGLRLEYTTLGRNVIEIGFLVYAAIAARLVALAGFAWARSSRSSLRWSSCGSSRASLAANGSITRVRLIGLAFLALAAYISAQAVVTLALDIRPDTSPLGIGWLTATCVVMFGLAAGKLRTGRRIGFLRWEDAVRLALEEPIHDETAEEETQ